MATPGETRDQALKDLRSAEVGMTDPEYLMSLEGQPTTVKTDAARKLLNTHHARIALENEELKDIRDKLIANEDEFKAATKSLKTALKALNDVQTVLKAVTALLDVIAKIVPLLL
jgi:hypothetical protein